MAGPVLRAKMRVESVLRNVEPDGSTSFELVKLRAVYGNNEENSKWSKWTPSGTLEIQINNPEAYGKLSNGHEFFVDFTPAVKPAADADEVPATT
jgi:hypothetical protein